MLPQLAAGSCTPTPSMDSADSLRMKLGTDSEALMMTQVEVCGRTCLVMIHQDEAPAAFEASMYSFCLIESTMPRMTRARLVQARRLRIAVITR
ncbi:hypothetical protein D3C87_1896100 [compost metagenome]